jgi:hypothetical protein
MEELRINVSYELLKGAPFGRFYFTVANKIIGNFIDGKAENSYLLATIKSIAEFIEKANRTSFYEETPEQLFKIARKQYIEENEFGKVYENLQYNLSIIPQTDIFDGFIGGLFCIRNKFHLYCELMGDRYVSTIIDLHTFERRFYEVMQKMKSEGIRL